MFKPCFIVYLEGPEFKSEIKRISKDKNIDYYFATRGDQISQFVKTYVPFLVLFDLTGLDSGWLFRHISVIKHMRPELPVCALVDDDQENIRNRAEKYGCNRILVQSEFMNKLPDVIENALRKTML